MDNVVNLFKKKDHTEVKQTIEYALDSIMTKLETFEDYNTFLVALATVVADTCVQSGYCTGKAPDPEVYCSGLKKIIELRYQKECFNV